MKTRKVLEKRIKKKKSPTVPAIKSRECCLEDVVFFITTRLKKKPLRWFESAPSELNPVTMIKKKLSNFVLDGRQRKVCVDDCRIYNSLIYKMSAPYRHMMSWRKCKTIFKKIQRINNLDGIAPITKLCVNPSDSFYFLTDESVEFICAFLIFRYLSLCRLRNLCIEAASYCMAQVRRNFFMTENMLLIGLLAKIFEQSKSHILDAVQVYELAVSILHNERFPKDLKALNGYEVDHKCSTNNFEESSLSIFLKATQISNSSINVFMSKEERNISSESLNGDYSKSFEKSNGCNELQQALSILDVGMNEDLTITGGATMHLLSGLISWGLLHVVVEGALAAALVYVILLWTKQKEQNVLLTERQLENWNPEPLVPETPAEHPGLNPAYVEGKMGKYLSINGKEYLNLATSNFLGLVGDERIEKVAKQTIFKYGVGSCGPRGFYGTVDVHLDLEQQIAEFLSCEEAVLYSYGFATIASAIPAYAKRGDVIFADKGVNFAIQKGLQASRSRIVWFEHNDVNDLERLLIEQSELDKKNPKIANSVRRFLVVEGLYINSGDLCPLPALMDLKWKYKLRIFIDESISFGVIGATGRGVTEHFGIDILDVDMIMGSLENAVASTGGFCAGRTFVVGHQRLSGLGYCFSASLPPLLATAASESLRIMNSEPDRFERLRTNTKSVYLGLEKAFENSSFEVVGCEFSPVQHIQCKNCTKEEAERRLDQLVDKLYQKMIAVSRARYLEKEEQFPKQPSIRVMIQSELTAEEIAKFLDAVHESRKEI